MSKDGGDWVNLKEQGKRTTQRGEGKPQRTKTWTVMAGVLGAVVAGVAGWGAYRWYARKTAEEEAADEFDRHQSMADDLAEADLPEVKRIVDRHFPTEEVQTKLQSSLITPEEQSVAQEQLKVMCFGRAVSALYALHFLLLLRRVVVNMIARPSSGSGSVVAGRDMEASINQQHLSSTAFLPTLEGLKPVLTAVESAVTSVFSATKIEDKVTFQDLKNLLAEVFTRVDKCVVLDGGAANTLLPNHLTAASLASSFMVVEDNDDVMGCRRSVVDGRLDETRKWLRSAEFQTALMSARDNAHGFMLKSLKEKVASSNTVTEFRLCYCLGRLWTLADDLLHSPEVSEHHHDAGQEGGVNEFIEEFAACCDVVALCKAVRHQEV